MAKSATSTQRPLAAVLLRPLLAGSTLVWLGGTVAGLVVAPQAVAMVVVLSAVTAALLALLFRLSWLRLQALVARPLAGLVATMDGCAVNGKAMRAKEQPSSELQAVAATLNHTLDRIVRNEAKIKAVIEAAGDGIVTINHRGIIQSFNPAAEAMFGHRAASIIGRNVALLMPEPHARKHDGYLRRYLDTDVATVIGRNRETMALRADGTAFPIAIHVTRVDLGADEPPLFCGILRDVTTAKQTENEVLDYTTQMQSSNVQLAEASIMADLAKAQAEAASRSKSEFLANMSHEIRTPMTAILGYAENLLDPEMPPADRLTAVRTILRNGEHLVTLINDILDLSKIEAGRLMVERLPCSPLELLAEVATLMRVRAEGKGLVLNTVFEGRLPTIAVTDPTRLRQVLLNLCSNALKFTEVGSVTLAMRLVRSGSGHRLQYDVIDTGIGLNQDEVPRLFRPFEQADTSTTRRFGGTGLGLSISKRLAGMLGGDIQVTSAPGRGSTFRLTIDPGPLHGVPLLDNVSEASLAARRGAAGLDPGRTAVRLQGRLLLAEDGADNQRLVSFILEKAGLQVVVAGDGRAALDLALQAEVNGTPFDVVLMDMQMPVMDGYQATGELRRSGFHKPIIALTANAMAGDREKCLAAGCTDFASKPIDRAALVATIAGLLARDPGGS